MTVLRQTTVLNEASARNCIYRKNIVQACGLMHLATEGPTMQDDLPRMFQIESATLSEIVATLARKGLVTSWLNLPISASAHQ